MKYQITVITCTHNPRLDFLEKTLGGLRRQALPLDQWELLIIDNASNPPLQGRVDISWHPSGRILSEPALGKTCAMLKGISESQGDVLIVVDDDNVLAPDYFEQVVKIGREWPMLGAWGGSSEGEFEAPPPDWTRPYWPSLAIRNVDRPYWSNLVNQFTTTPFGAGLCVRADVAGKYAATVRTDPRRLELDRKGKSLTSCGDSDMAFTACDIGLGTGLFPELRLTHLMPKGRLEEDYLVRLIEGLEYSKIYLHAIRGELPPPIIRGRLDWLRQWIRFFRTPRRARRFQDALHRAKVRATTEILTGRNHADSPSERS